MAFAGFVGYSLIGLCTHLVFLLGLFISEAQKPPIGFCLLGKIANFVFILAVSFPTAQDCDLT